MCKILLDFSKYLLNYSRFVNPLEPDVHHMTSQILPILIDFTQTSVPLFQSFFQSLDLYNYGTRKDIKETVNGDVSNFLRTFR